jgi:hypothetical protein
MSSLVASREHATMSMMESYWTDPADTAACDVSPEPCAHHVSNDQEAVEHMSGGPSPAIDVAALDLCIRADLWP